MKIAIIDLFCGAGGTTTGVERAKMFGRKVAKVIACVNHDETAIASHKSNHKGVLHFTEDIRVLNLDRIIKLVIKYREIGYTIGIWASLECTNFSNAKGGQPRNADSRTLAEHLHRYIEAICPEYIFIENVVEFMSWGPLNEKGKPESRDKGKDYMQWINDICTLHPVKYGHDHAILNSADYGAHTSRKRYFGVFAATGLPIRFPQATHSKNPGVGANLFETPNLKKWKPVKEVLDLQDEGKSIFDRSKELSPKTLARIYAGLVKYVAGGKDSFIAKYYSGRPAGKVISTEGPAGTITCVDSQSLVKANFLLKYNSTNKDGVHVPPSIEDPCPVIATQNRLGIVKANFLMNYHHSSDVNSMDNPCPTLVTRDKLAVVNPSFLAKYHGNGDNVLGMDDTCSTLTTKDRLAKVTISPFLDKQYTGPLNHQSINQPAGTILANDKHALVTPKPFIDKQYNGDHNHQSIDQPAGSILTYDKHRLVTPKSFILNPSWFGNIQSLEQPACTIIARQDKAPVYLLTAPEGQYNIPVYETDCKEMVEIKKFMALYNIVDIKMRMLKVPELLKIQGFPAKYVLRGNQSQQKKFIGNSVVPLVAELIIKEIYKALTEHYETKNAA